MREIEFRGMHSHMFSCNEHLDGTWVYGYLVDENYINDKRDMGDGEYLGEMLIDPETVGQFTGLLDKNGTKIFEGDVIFITESVRAKIDWNKETSAFCVIGLGATCGMSDHLYGVEHCEVIGNIHDNPELLEEESK